VATRFRRVLALAALAAALLTAFALLVAHTPMVRARALRWAVTLLETRYGLVLTADHLSYNLVTGSAGLDGVRLAVRGHEGRPLLTAARLHIDVPLTAYLGAFSLDDIAIEDGEVLLHRTAAGVSNLPSASGSPATASTGRVLPIRGVSLRNLAVRYSDEGSGLRVDAAGIDADLTYRAIRVFDGVTGPFTVREGVTISWPDRTLRVAPLDSRLAFDGSTVSVQDLPLVTPLARANVSGRVEGVLGSPAFDLSFDGTADLAEASAWLGTPVSLAGAPAVKGTLSGPLSSLSTTLRFDGAALTVGGESDLTASGELTVDAARVEGHRIHVSPASGGRLDASFVFPLAGEPPAAEAQWQNLDARVPLKLAGLEPPRVGATLDGTLSVASNTARQLSIDTTATALRARDLTPVDGRVTGRVNGDRWTLGHDVRLPGLSASGTASGQLDHEDLSRSTIAGPQRATIADLSVAAAGLAPLGLELPADLADLDGTIEAEIDVSGTLADPRARVEARAPELVIPGVGRAAVDAAIEADARMVAIPRVSATRGATRLDGRASIDLRTRAVEGGVEAVTENMIELQEAVPERWRASGAATARAVIGGTIGEPLADVVVEGGPLAVAGETIERLAGKARVTAAGVDVGALTIEYGAGRIGATGRYGFDRSYEIDLNITDVARAGLLAADAEARATLNGRFAGRGSLDEPAGTGRFRIGLAGGTAGDLVGDGTLDVTLAGSQARLTALVPALGALANATIRLQSPYEYHGVAALNRVDLARAAPLVGARTGEIDGQLSGSAAVSGALTGDTEPRVLANVQSVQATIAGVPFALAAPARVTWQPAALTLTDLSATLGDGTLTGSGTWSAGGGSSFAATFHGELADVTAAARAFGVDAGVEARGMLTLDLGAKSVSQITARATLSDGRIETGSNVAVTGVEMTAALAEDRVTLTRLSGRLEGPKASGAFSATGEATLPDLDVRRAVGRVVVERAQVDTAGVEVRQRRPSAFSIANGVVTLDDVEWEAAGSAIRAEGQVDLSSGTPALSLNARGVAVLRVLSAFVPALAFDGTAGVDVRLGGTASNPDLSGTVDLQQAEIALASPRVLVSDLNGTVALSGNRIELRGLTGTANGGALVVDGGVLLTGTAVGTGEVSLQAQNVALEFPSGLRSEIDALVTLDLDRDPPELFGDVRVLRGSYTEPISLAALAGAAAEAAPRPPGAASALDDVRLNVAVTTVEDLLMDNNYGRLDGGVDVRVVGTAGQPGLTGRVALREGGRVYAAGRTFTLTRGTVTFTELDRIEPELDLQAETRVTSGGVGDVTLTVQGTPDRLTTDLSSSEGKSREEIASALLGGGVTGANAASLLAGDLLGVTGRQLGLDAVRLDREDVAADEIRQDPSVLATDEDPTTRLTISKRIRDNVEFTISQNLRESGRITYILSYFPLPNLELRGVSRDNAALGVAIRHQVTFGAPAATTAATRATPPSIASVEFEGDLTPLTEENLRRQTRLRPGERFDFYQWQSDLDRLTAAFVDRGYLEARVRGRRVERTPESLDVVFSIDRGPSTRLAVEGLVLSGAEERAIRETWQRAVFDRFLIEDAEARVRRRLIADGYFEGVVQGSIETSGDTKTLRLAVTPGARAAGREIRFTGNAAIATGQLQSIVAQAGLELDAWLDPQPLVEALESLYRDEGYLDVVVTAGEPRKEGTIGVLPVTIVEGAQATIGRVDLVGVGEARQAVVREALQIEPPAPYSAARVRAARERVLLRYRTRGFNSAEVRAVTEAPGASAPLVLTVTVAEGPQQVLQEVRTAGATRTREGIVDRALRLRVGEAVNLEEWSEARRRLYDTNVFRTVDLQAIPLGDPVDGVQPVRAVVTVEEYPHWRLRYGFQVDRERVDEGGEEPRFDTSPGAIAELRNANLLGRALIGGLAARVERDYQYGSLFLSSASFRGLPVRSGVFGYLTRDRFRFEGEVFSITDTSGISLEQRWRRGRLELTYGYRFERNNTYVPGSSSIGANELDVILDYGKLNWAVSWDRRDDPLDAGRGTFSSFSWEEGAEWLASDARYRRLLAQQQVFRSLGRFVFAARVLIGDTSGRDVVLPADRFTAGGATTVRGYGENSLGPRGLFGEPLGGDAMFVLNQEVRVPVFRRLRAVGFFDAGNVFAEDTALFSSALKIGYGVGMRFDSPIGMLRLDYGIPGSTLSGTSSRANGLTSGRWYFGFGHIF
jgi:outer membrane protein assembly factor BamA/autotransporter translocation and assembly factor TamB